jgi:hypothetical protein
MHLNLFTDNCTLNYKQSRIWSRSYVELITPQSTTPINILCSDDYIECIADGYFRYCEKLTQTENGIFGNIEVEVLTNHPFVIHCPFIFPKTEEMPYFTIPAFLYGTNNKHFAVGNFPKLAYGQKSGWPESGIFNVPAWRSSHNAVLIAQQNNVSMLAINETSASKELKISNGLTLNTSNELHNAIGFQIGFLNNLNNSYLEQQANNDYLFQNAWIENAAGRTFSTQVQYFTTSGQGFNGCGTALQVRYQHIRPKSAKNLSRNKAILLLVNKIEQTANNEEQYAAWKGGMQTALPLLMAAHKLSNNELRRKTCQYIDQLIADRQTQCGFMNDVSIHSQPQALTLSAFSHKLHSATVNGQAAYFLLKAYITENQQNSHWYIAAKKIVDRALQSQRRKGTLASFYYPVNGNPALFEGFQSCWMIAATALIASLSNSLHYQKCAQLAFDYYLNGYAKGELYGSANDADNAVNSEVNLGFIEACSELYALTLNEKYIEATSMALHWEYSWKYAYNSLYFNKIEQYTLNQTCGVSVNGVAQPELSAFNNCISGSLFQHYCFTGNPYHGQRLEDLCRWSLSTVNQIVESEEALSQPTLAALLQVCVEELPEDFFA